MESQNQKHSPIRRFLVSLIPHAGWDAIKTLAEGIFGSALFSSLLAFIQKYRYGSLDWVAISATFAVSLAALVLLRKTPDRSANAAPGKIAASTAPTVLIPTPPPRPATTVSNLAVAPPIDLRGDILDFYFSDRTLGFGLQSGWNVVVKLRVINHGLDQAVPVSWKLQIKIGDRTFDGALANIPEQWRIKRDVQGTLLPVSNYERLAPSLDQETQVDAYKRGKPNTGWLYFEISDYGHFEFPHGGEFTITIKDSLGGLHRIVRKPDAYSANNGKLVPYEPTGTSPTL